MENISVGRPIILPSSFQGSPRAMHQLYQDAMCIVSHFGKPSAFVTITCNPNWPEIEAARNGRSNADIPHIISRVFNIYLRSIIKDIFEDGVCGKVVSKLQVIEFQKRGLPHAHVLIKLAGADDIVTVDQVDQLISAEIPDPNTHPLLYETVSNTMLHGPCNERCIVDGECSKHFPKDFQETTILDPKGYPRYKRPDNGRFVEKNGHVFTNRHVVPYCPYLSQKYNCHINFEACISIRSVKYQHKYVYKGYDCANVKVTQIVGHNEIDQFVNGRYVSAPEAAWRIHGFPMHDQSHKVHRLAVHDENAQTVMFGDGGEEQAVARARLTETQLQAWFTLNREDPEARTLLYTEVPFKYTFKQGRWVRRIRRPSIFSLSRLYTVSPRDVSRFHLRILLLHVRGAKSFEDLRTVSVNGERVVHSSFQDACRARGLINDNQQWRDTLAEAAQSQMPYQLRSLFACLLVYCDVSDAAALWEEFADALSEDLAQRMSLADAHRGALSHIQSIVVCNGLDMERFGLPSVDDVFRPWDGIIDDDDDQTMYQSLNNEQRGAADAILESVNDYNSGNVHQARMFFVDGPGGTGKSYLYNFLASHLRQNGQSVSMSATSGVAATVLKGGRTVHSTFALPLKLHHQSTSHINMGSVSAQKLRETSLFVIDEVSMLSKFGLHVIDRLLRSLMSVDIPFGGKVVLFGGDFRQTLPVIPRGNETDIIDNCVTSSPLWANCVVFKLTKNMRAEGDNKFSRFLLELGNGSQPLKKDDPYSGCIELPNEVVHAGDITDSLFPAGLSQDEIVERVILTPRNDTSLRLNDKILRRQPGNCRTLLSADKAECENPEDEHLYQTEFLNSLTPSGMPPHKLLLKEGAVVMLLRNLHTEGGLCNGTRLVVRQIHAHFIECDTLIGSRRVFIPKICMRPSNTTLPFQLCRTQFPLRLAYCMTINKSQGQTLERVGVYLERPVFGHGQLYVACSRTKSFDRLSVQIVSGVNQGVQNGHAYTKNIIYPQLISQFVDPFDEDIDFI